MKCVINFVVYVFVGKILMISHYYPKIYELLLFAMHIK